MKKTKEIERIISTASYEAETVSANVSYIAEPSNNHYDATVYRKGTEDNSAEVHVSVSVPAVGTVEEIAQSIINAAFEISPWS